jgi:benzoyl-CoA reductase/2-hydroxyglutaryl-CoA dehydratase subunit BcrC/BadD/HgdB
MPLKPYELLDTTLLIWKQSQTILKYPFLAYLGFRYIARPLFGGEETEKNKVNRFALLQAGGGLSPPEELRAMRHSLQAQIASVGGATEAAKQNEPVVWFDWTAPSVLIKAFGVESICTSMFSKIPNFMGSDCTTDHLEAAENEGVSPDMCSMTRLPIGAYILNQLPEPHAFISTGHPCDSGRSSNQILNYLCGKDVPVFASDSPYDRGESGIAQYTRDVWEMVKFLEKHLGRPMDWDRLKALVDEMNLFNHYLKETAEMHRNVPSPGLGFASLTYTWPLRLFAPGAPEGTKYAKALYDISRDRIGKKSQKRAKKEKIRVIITGPPVIFTDFYRWMEKEFGAYVVADYLVQTVNPEIDTSSEEAMIRGIALDNMLLGMARQSHGPVELIADDLEGIIDAYSADCIISYGNIACKHKNGVPKIFKDICNKSGLPSLLMKTDLFDKRINSEEEIKQQISDFFIDSGLVT